MLTKIIDFIMSLFTMFSKGDSNIWEHALIPSGKNKGKIIDRHTAYKQLYKKENAEWDDAGINICGFRDPKRGWNDTIAICYRDVAGKGIVEEFEATTDPGVESTKTVGTWSYGTKNLKGRKVKTTGAAHLIPGFYKSWKVGLHRKSYRALVQRVDKVKMWADFGSIDPKEWQKDKNIRFDFGGINIHYGLGYKGKVWKASAGCQVIKGKRQWKKFIKIVESYEDKAPGRTYSYLLTSINNYPKVG